MWKLSLTLTLVAALVGCQKPSSLPVAQAEPLQKITVAVTIQPQGTFVHVAMAQGYFAEEGIDVRQRMQPYGKAALKLVLDNQADLATVSETPVMFSVLNGDKICMIASIEASSMNNGVVARKDAGIAEPGDLKGKRIGFTPGTGSDFFLDALLAANGLTRLQIQAVPLAPDEMAQAIRAGQVDALATWDFPLTQIKHQLGSGGLIFYDPQIYTQTFTLAAKQDFVRKNPEIVKRFLRALIKAESFVLKNPDQAQAILSAASHIDKALVSEVWHNFNFEIVLNQTLLITLEDATRWAMKNKLTTQTVMPDYASFIHSDSLQAIKPEAVKAIR